jgi:hypothetical protein
MKLHEDECQTVLDGSSDDNKLCQRLEDHRLCKTQEHKDAWRSQKRAWLEMFA